MLDKGKDVFDPVTRADREAELEVRRMISERWSGENILGEEFGGKVSSSPYWVIDPIDGTRSFITGSPLWGVLLAFNDGVSPAVGVIDMPALNERFSGCRDKTEWLRAGRLTAVHTRECLNVRNAMAAATSPSQFISPSEQEGFRALSERVRLVRFGGDCYNYGLLAAGKLDLVIEASLKTEDVQALLPVVTGAGGVISDWRGGDAAKGGKVVASGNYALHEAVLELLAKNT